MGREPCYPCRWPGCAATTDGDPPYCPEHRQAADDAHRAPADEGPRIYDTRRWRRFRKQILSERPVCEDCDEALATQVDHIIRVRVMPQLAFDPVNVQALCHPCHSRKTARETGWHRTPD